MTDEELVKQKWPDATAYKSFINVEGCQFQIQSGHPFDADF